MLQYASNSLLMSKKIIPILQKRFGCVAKCCYHEGKQFTCCVLFLHFANESGILLNDVVDVAGSVPIHGVVLNEVVGFDFVFSCDRESCSEHSGPACDGYSADWTSGDFGPLEAPSAKGVCTVEHLLVVGVVVAQRANDGGEVLNVAIPWELNWHNWFWK